MHANLKHTVVPFFALTVVLSSLFGAVAGFVAGSHVAERNISSGGSGISISKTADLDHESAVIAAVERVSPAVVSVIVTKDLPRVRRFSFDPFGDGFFERFFGNEFGDEFGIPDSEDGGTVRRKVGGGTGFIVSSDGLIMTNKHVVADEDAAYSVLLNDGRTLDANVVARDTVNDLAMLKVSASNLPTVALGSSDTLRVGQTVIAIGNALGEFRNTVSTGVISGLARSIVAGDSRFGSEQLTDVIQTDASINFGNSGGPLLNIAGEVIGVNTAIAAGAQNVGFAIPVSEARSVIESVETFGRIVRPWLGVRYILIDEEFARANGLQTDYGALIVRGERSEELAVVPGSPADKAGLTENDIILELDGKKIDHDHPLINAIGRKKPGDRVLLKVLHRGETKTVSVTLEERK